MEVTDHQAEILARLRHGDDLTAYLGSGHLDGLMAAGFVTTGGQPGGFALTQDGAALAQFANVPA